METGTGVVSGFSRTLIATATVVFVGLVAIVVRTAAQSPASGAGWKTKSSAITFGWPTHSPGAIDAAAKTPRTCSR